MTVHTLRYIHKKEDVVKEHFKKKLKKKFKKQVTKDVRGAGSTSTERGTRPEAPSVPPGLPKQKPTKTITTITDDIVNTYIQEDPDLGTNHLRNERVMKAQRKQMNARSLLNNAFGFFYFILYTYTKHGK